MKIAICIKQVPDTNAKIKLMANKENVDYTGIKWIISPYDEHAIEEAVKLRDANAGSSAIVFSVGPKSRVTEALRTALAMGADEAVLIDSPEDLDANSSSKLLAAAIKAEGTFDLVLAGKQSIDFNFSGTPQMLAEHLGVAHLSVVSKLAVEGYKARAERDVDGGTKEVFEVSLPAVISATKGLNTPRYPSLPGIMKAKKKVIKELAASTLGYKPADQKMKHVKYEMPPEKPAAKILPGSAAEQAKKIVQLLRDEAKVI